MRNPPLSGRDSKELDSRRNSHDGPNISQVMSLNGAEAAGDSGPSKEARTSFMSLVGKPLGDQLRNSENFATWSFSLHCALQLVGLENYVMKNASRPVWLDKLSKAAYLLIVRSLSASQSALIRSLPSRPKLVYEYLFKHNLGNSASMRDSRAAQLRSIRLTNVNHFVNYAEAITTCANELALLGDTSVPFLFFFIFL